MGLFTWESGFSPRFVGYAIVIGALLAGQNMIACNDSNPVSEVTDPNAQIVIEYPRGGETFTVGDTLRIQWKTQGLGLTDVNAVNIEISPDSGKTWATILGRSVAVGDLAWGNYAWKIQDSVTKLGVAYSLVDNSKLRLKISQYSTADTNKIATMKKTFSVVAR
ncbi:MAG: hypothetical protein JWO30_1681 [Fibrobacteres bacterium]|nr:hypothetical protein [Fibrobacterota bacterium]